MVHGLLFKWEDSAALKHHCGFCERPLNHPGARASCFGKHSEPCVRYHQAMFMRLRGHTCAYCLTIEEAHHKRHIDIAEKLRGLYDSCGEIDWTIIPCEPGDSRVAAKDGDSDLSPPLEDATASKRERKDAKNLARAANRSRVITQEEIHYVDSVLHSAEGVNNGDGPRNPEEIEEIERHLRYHAQVYNSQPDRRGLRKMSQFRGEDVDFDTEMERVLDIFRIAELIKRNTRNRGLQGRDMKIFEALLDDFRCAIVEDIVLVKKDVLEIRMRRAGYMRYTNKTAVTRVEDRYIDKDWKTGERLASSASDSSASSTPIEEPHGMLRKEIHPSTPGQIPPARRPDRRHLENIHTRVNGEDGLHESIIEPYTAPLLHLVPNLKSREKPMTLKFVNSDAKNNSQNLDSNFTRVKRSQPIFNGWHTLSSGKKTVLPVRVAPSNTRPVAPPAAPESTHNGARAEMDLKFRALPCTQLTKKATNAATALSVQSAAKADVSKSREPEAFISHVTNPITDSAFSHAVISQKKKGKKEREAKRKAKKLAPHDQLSKDSPKDEAAVAAGDEADSDSAEALAIPTSDKCPDAVDDRENKRYLIETSSPAATGSENIDLADVDAVCAVQDQVTASDALVVTTHGKHMHWHRFTRNLIVDQLTPPCMISWHTPATGAPDNAAACAFERHSEPDCPFHDASRILDDATSCTCCAYRKDICYLAYPGVDECSLGPLDRLHCERLLEMYENDSRTQGQLMLVDVGLHDYVRSNMGERYGDRITDTMPKILAREYADFFDKYKGSGPLMVQEHLYQRLAAKNRILKHPISSQLLHKMHLTFEPKDSIYTCYCHTKVVRGTIPEDTLVCSHRDCTSLFFHKSCVKKRHPDNVTRWYCTNCAQEMKDVARDVLCASDSYEEHMAGEISCQVRDEVIRRMMEMPDAEFEKVKASMLEAGFRV